MSVTPQRLIAVALTAVVASVLAGAAFVLDPPDLQRQRRLDERRTHDLYQLSLQIKVWYLVHKELPPDLKALSGGRVGGVWMADPVSSEPYEYLPQKNGEYRLCAVFRTEAAGAERNGPDWRHGKGRHCFALNAAPG